MYKFAGLVKGTVVDWETQTKGISYVVRVLKEQSRETSSSFRA